MSSRHVEEEDGTFRTNPPEDSLEGPRSLDSDCSLAEVHCSRLGAGRSRHRRTREVEEMSFLRGSHRAGPLWRNPSVKTIKKIRWAEKYRKSRFL